jgi:PKD repeat protein
MRRLRYATLAFLSMLVSLVGASPAFAVQYPQTSVVADRAVSWTPAINDGAVQAIVQVGDTMVVGGTFTSVTSPAGGAALPQAYLLAFDATTGQIRSGFRPVLDGAVNALTAGADGQSVYVGGSFGTVNGQRSKSVALLSLTNGQAVPGFRTPVLNGAVTDLRLSAGRLWLGGNFSKMYQQDRPAIATVNAATGAADPYFALEVSGTHNGGRTSLQKFDISADGSRLLAIGNFTSVGGQARHQVVMLDLTGAAAAVANWATSFYTASCAAVFDSYLRDLDISPDGSYAVISTTGAYRGSTGPCDTTSRWELDATGTNVTPTWVDYTGGDTTYAVAVTDAAVYVGGHFRWQNNAFAGDRASQGAVAREGIAALDPANGLPLAWDPGRARGVGVFDILATSEGLWVGSDTDRIGGWNRHPKLAFFPLRGGFEVPSTATRTLPGPVLLAGDVPGASADAIVARSFDGTHASATTPADGAGISWSQSRGSVVIGDSVYTGWADGNLYARTYDGETFGPAVNVDGMDQLVRLTTFHNEVPNITAMFFDSGRLYYAIAGQSTLYYRYFTPSTKVIGAVRYTATNTSGVSFANASALILSGGTLYVGDRTSGTLRAVSFSAGAVSGAPVTVSGPTVDGQSWRGRSIFVAPAVPNMAPVAGFTAECELLTCSFDSSSSHDEDGTIAGYAWTFEDGETSTAANPEHTFSAGGTHAVTLTVTDNRGATASSQQQLTVSDAAPQLAFVGAASANANARSVDVTVPGGVGAGDAMVLVATSANDEVDLTAPAGWTSLSTTTSNGMRTEVWQRTAQGDESGTSVALALSTRAKVNLTLGVYSGASADQDAVVMSASETIKRADHTTPTAEATVSGSWVLSYWADDTTDTTTWTAPGGQTVRRLEVGSGGGHVASLLTDGEGASPLGTVGGLTATASSANAKAQMLTILLAPAH